MPLPVRIQDIVDGMEMQSDLLTSYLHRSTGVVYTIGEEDFNAVEFDDNDDGINAVVQAIDRDPEAYLALPDSFDVDEYRMMERFALATTDLDIQERLLTAIRGRGAFRRFKDAVHRLGIATAWYQARDEAYTKIAREWCRTHGIAFVDSGSDVVSLPASQ